MEQRATYEELKVALRQSHEREVQVWCELERTRMRLKQSQESVSLLREMTDLLKDKMKSHGITIFN